MDTNFNDFRFEGLNCKNISNKYMTMNRVSDDKDKIVVKVADSHLQRTKYGYALILDHTHVVFLKDWQVDQNYYGNEVLLNKKFFNPKEWGTWEDFFEEPDQLEWDTWMNAAIVQDSFVDEDGNKLNRVKWTR